MARSRVSRLHVDSKLAAARLDFVELLAGDGAVFLVFSRRPKWSKVRESAHPAHMCDCESLTLDISTSHRREPQVEVDLLSTFDGRQAETKRQLEA